MTAVLDLWRNLTRSRTEVEAAELQEEMREVGVIPIRECQHGAFVCVTGIVRVITVRPTAATPALEIEIYDGSGCVSVIWLGRRRIPGIATGRRIVVSGRLTCSPNSRVIYNPRYQLLPTSS